MSEAKSDSTDGVKIFFVVPELSTLPEEFLKNLFLMGYETYSLGDDPYCPLEAKIQVLFTRFFNIDRAIRGITYHKRYDSEEVRRLERDHLQKVNDLIIHNLRTKMDSLLSHEYAASPNGCGDMLDAVS